MTTTKHPSATGALGRVLRRVEVTACGCWVSTLGVTPLGYSYVSVGGRQGSLVSAHRFVYETLVGVIPDRMQLDHLCRVRNCVNPDHLQVVTQAENLRRGVSPSALVASSGRCARGHSGPWVPNGPNKKTCGTCRTQRQRQRSTQ